MVICYHKSMDIQQSSDSSQVNISPNNNQDQSKIKSGWALFKRSFSYLFQKPVFLVPIFLCWVIVASLILYLRYYVVLPESNGLAFLEIYGFVFVISYVICLANLILLELMYQVDNNQPTSLAGAFKQMISVDALKALPIAIFFSIVWFIILILRALRSKSKRSAHEPSLHDAALTLSGINGSPFSWIGLGLSMLEKLLRMTVFLALPAIAWEDMGSFSAFSKAVEIIKKRPVQFLTTYALTGVAAAIMALPLIPIAILNKANVALPDIVWLGVIIYEGIIWTLGIYLEQMSVASLYLWYTKNAEVTGLEEGFSSMKVPDGPESSSDNVGFNPVLFTAPQLKHGVLWSGLSITGGILFVYLAFTQVASLILSFINLPPNIVADFSFIVSLISVIVGSFFGAKYVITRANIDESSIWKVSLSAGLISGLLNIFVFIISILISRAVSGSTSTEDAVSMLQPGVIDISLIVLLFITTFIALKRYIKLPKDHDYVKNWHMYTLLLIILVSLGVRLGIYYVQQNKENAQFNINIEQIEKQNAQDLLDSQKKLQELLSSPASSAQPSSSVQDSVNNSVTEPEITSGLTGLVGDDASDNIISGAKIKFISADGKIIKETTSDADGRYLISLPAGKYKVTATYPGFEFSTGDGYFIVSGGRIEVGNIFMIAK